MPLTPIEFVGQSTSDPDNAPANPGRLVNCYRERIGGRTEYVIKSVLGMTPFATLTGVFCRAMERVENYVYAVHGGRLWRIAAAGAVLDCGAVDDSPETTIAGNNGNVTVVSGGKYYIWDGAALTNIVAGAFDDFGSVIFTKQLTILTELDGRRVQWSAAATPASLNALDLSTTEQRDDKVLRGFPIGGEVWFFKETCIERWFVGDDGPVFQGGGVIEKGLKSFRLLTAREGGAFFIGSDNKAYLVATGAFQPVSTLPVETSIKTQGPRDVVYYQDEGHEFCAILFDGRPAWVYDISTGEWHERGEGGWAISAAVSAWGGFYVTTLLGAVAKLDKVRTDMGEPLVYDIVGTTLQNARTRFKVPEFRLQGKVGFYTIDYDVDPAPTVLQVSGDNVLQVSGDNVLQVSPAETQTPPELMFYWSWDHGQTWQGPRFVSIGNRGEYKTEMVIRALGQGRAFTPRVRFSEPLDFTMDATAFVRAA